jgi:hypothetical protein
VKNELALVDRAPELGDETNRLGLYSSRSAS